MKTLAELSLIYAYVAIIMGTLVILRNGRDPVHRIFFLFCAGAFYWCFVEYGMRHANSLAEAQIWSRAFSFWPLPEAFMLHFALLYCGFMKQGRRFGTLFLLYAPALAFSLIDLLTMRISGVPVLVPWGWTYGMPQTWEKTASVIWACMVTTASVGVCVWFVCTTVIPRRRKQGAFILCGFLTLVAAGYSTDVASFLLNRRIPEMSSLGFASGAGFIGYAIFRYNLFNLAPTAAAREIIDTIRDVLLLVDDKGTIVSANRAAFSLLGYDASELVGRPLDFAIAYEDRDSVKSLVDRRNSRPGDGHTEISLRTKQAGVIPFSVSTSVVRDRQGIYQGTIFVAHDVSGYKVIQEKLFLARQEAENASRAKSDFLAGMSHELRTPLNAIIGFSEAFLAGIYGRLDEKQEDRMSNIHSAGIFLVTIINDVLDLSKIEAGKMELNLSDVDVRSLIEQSTIMIREKCSAHGIRLGVEIPSSPANLVIWADERKLKQVVFNLLSNAAKFTPDGGAITVTASLDKKNVMVSVSDNGIGIDPLYQSKIFGEFYQIHSGLSSKTPGTGLGLALCKSIVEMHGGKIWVEARDSGTGSVFMFTIPLEAREKQGRYAEPVKKAVA
jgi:PAS domain S-box-containing protein